MTLTAIGPATRYTINGLQQVSDNADIGTHRYGIELMEQLDGTWSAYLVQGSALTEAGAYNNAAWTFGATGHEGHGFASEDEARQWATADAQAHEDRSRITPEPVSTVAGMYRVYHRDQSSNPEAHRSEQGPWYYAPRDADTNTPQSGGYLTREMALLAADEDELLSGGLALRREALGMSQQRLADALDIPRNTIARWERRELPLRHSRLLHLALQTLERQAIS